MLGKMDAPGRPTMYKTTQNFLKMFGLTNLEELPELPRYKVDENDQIVIDDVIEENNKQEKSEEIPEQAKIENDTKSIENDVEA